MKKLSLLMAFAMLITIGGVYATWDYAEKLAEVKTVEMPGVIQMTDYTNATAKGAISVDATNLTVMISDSNDDFLPELTHDTTDYVEIRFVPAQNASDDIKSNGITLKFWFTLTNGADKTYDYDGDGTKDDIFNINAGEDAANAAWMIGRADSESTIKWEYDAETETFIAKIPADVIFGTTDAAAITFNDVVKLDTLEKYHAFDSAVNNGRFVLNLAEVTA